MVRKSKKKTAPEAAQANPPPTVPGLKWANAEQPRAQLWYWPGAIPAGALVMLEGRKATGKSTIAAAIAAAVTGGPAPVGWCGPRDGRVIWESAEDSWGAVVIPRLAAAGATLARVARLENVQQSLGKRKPKLPGDISYLDDLILSANIRLLIVDPFLSLASSLIDVRIEQQAREYLDPLAEVCERRGCVALLLRHVRKGTAGDAREHGMGSVAITNVARSLMRCDEHPDEPGELTLSVVASNYSRPRPTEVFRLEATIGGPPKVVWTGQTTLSAEQLAAGQGSEAERDEYSDTCKLLCQAIGFAWISYRDVVAVSSTGGITERMLRRAKVRLGVRSRQVYSGGHNYFEWGPPPQGWPAGLLRQLQLPTSADGRPSTPTDPGEHPIPTANSVPDPNTAEGGPPFTPGRMGAERSEGVTHD